MNNPQAKSSTVSPARSALVPAVLLVVVLLAVTGGYVTRTTKSPGLPRAIVDRPSQSPSAAIHLIYAVPKGSDDRKRDINGDIERSALRVQDWFRSNTGGREFVFDSHREHLDISFHQLDLGVRQLDRLDTNWAFSSIVSSVQEAGFSTPSTIYVIYVEDRALRNCGEAQLNYATIVLSGRCTHLTPKSESLTAGDLVLGHELLHAFGAVPDCATHLSEQHAHVTDDRLDVMFHEGTRQRAPVIDKAKDDYFDHSIPACPDMADSTFIRPSARTQRPHWFGNTDVISGGFESQSDSLPKPWSVTEAQGGVIRLDRAVSKTGSSSVRLEGASEKSLARVSQCSFGGRLRDSEVVFGGTLRSQRMVGLGATVYLSVMGWNGVELEFVDPFGERKDAGGSHYHVQGDTEWTEYSATAYVPPYATWVCIGVLLQGSGQAWADDLYLK